MAREFRLPDIGEGLTEAEVVRWLVPEGEYVGADQPLVEVETDKAVVEIPSPYAGIVLEHGAAEGEVIEVGSVLVVIGEEGEVEEEVIAGMSEPAAAAVDEEPRSQEATMPESGEGIAPIVGTISNEAEDLTPSAPEVTAATGLRVQALPIVRKLARDLGVDISKIRGSGPEGRITREDVQTAAAAVAEEPIPQPEGVRIPVVAHPPQPASAVPSPSGADERRPMSRLRRTIAANMVKSWSDIPHVTTFDDVDATRLLEVRSALGSRHGVKIPLETLVLKAVVPALRAFPEFNATIDGDDLVIHGWFDIGIAVDTPEGLLVAVIRDAASKGVMELAAEIRRLGEGARERSLGPDELTGQTFTLSNIGAVGGGHGTPLVPYGTTALLSVGRAKQRPVVIDGDLAIAPVMPLSLSYDHRVIDGGLGRRFMALVIENLEEPALFLAD